jgi:hypothetical protein
LKKFLKYKRLTNFDGKGFYVSCDGIIIAFPQGEEAVRLNNFLKEKKEYIQRLLATRKTN